MKKLLALLVLCFLLSLMAFPAFDSSSANSQDEVIASSWHRRARRGKILSRPRVRTTPLVIRRS
jgi:putative cell wall-binding protein